jgi:hypothetical protein
MRLEITSLLAELLRLLIAQTIAELSEKNVVDFLSVISGFQLIKCGTTKMHRTELKPSGIAFYFTNNTNSLFNLAFNFNFCFVQFLCEFLLIIWSNDFTKFTRYIWIEFHTTDLVLPRIDVIKFSEPTGILRTRLINSRLQKVEVQTNSVMLDKNACVNVARDDVRHCFRSLCLGETVPCWSKLI